MPVLFQNGSLTLVPATFVPPLAPGDVPPCRSEGVQRLGRNVVDAIARAGWDLHDLDVRVRAEGSGRAAMRRVTSIRGRIPEGPFRLTYQAIQECREGAGYRTGLSKVAFPFDGGGLEVEFKDVDSYPNAALYVGDGTWPGPDADAFVDDHKVNSRLSGHPRRHVQYAYGRGKGLLVDTDMGREYEAQGDEPRVLDPYVVVAAAERFLSGLQERLAALPAKEGWDDLAPEGDANLRRLLHVDPTPLPDRFPPKLYSWVSRDHAMRLADALKGWDDGSQDYALAGNGWRLVGRGFLSPEERAKIHPRAFDGFSYASEDPGTKAGHCVHGGGEYPVVVELACLDEIYVVDNALFDQAKAEALAQAGASGRDGITERELDACIARVATSFVPAADYDGSYGSPQYLIGRQLGRGEARIMRGKVSVEEDGRRVVLSGPDGDALLYRGDVFGRSRETARSMVEFASWIARLAPDPEDRVEPAMTMRA